MYVCEWETQFSPTALPVRLFVCLAERCEYSHVSSYFYIVIHFPQKMSLCMISRTHISPYYITLYCTTTTAAAIGDDDETGNHTSIYVWDMYILIQSLHCFALLCFSHSLFHSLSIYTKIRIKTHAYNEHRRVGTHSKNHCVYGYFSSYDTF